MTVDFFVWRTILALKLCLDVSGCVLIGVGPCIFREADAEGRLLDLLCKQVLLVEEKDDGGVDEELVVADGVKQHQRFMHAIRGLILMQHLVISTERHTENYGCHILKTVDPLLSL